MYRNIKGCKSADWSLREGRSKGRREKRKMREMLQESERVRKLDQVKRLYIAGPYTRLY